jgi:hypothetical protein
MTTADWALIISICSVFLSLAALAWNIWSKFIYPKPSLVVTFAVMEILDEDGLHDPFLNLSITNHGPIVATVASSLAQTDEGFFRRRRFGLIQPLTSFLMDPKHTSGPFTGLPKKLEVGEEFSLKYWYGESSFIGNPRILRVGVRDSFGRLHWCRRSDVKKARKHFLDDEREGKLRSLSEDDDDTC